MAYIQNSTGRAPVQLPVPPRITELKAVFEVLSLVDGAILKRLAAPDHLGATCKLGRRGYSTKALWRAYVASFYLNLGCTNDLIRQLEDDPYLRQICGFRVAAPLPGRRTFNRFIRGLARHSPLVERALARLTTRLKAALPDLGQEVAIDSTAVRSHANHKKKSDPEASWAVGHSPRSKDKNGKSWTWGYKVHAMVDANYGIPLAHYVTTGRRNDSPELPTLVAHAKALHPWLKPQVAIADRGYDSAANHQALWHKNKILPIIHIRKLSNTDLYQGIFTEQGIPTCVGMVPMEYVATNKEGHHLYRCRKEGCHLKDSKQGGTRHCDTVYLQDPSENIRLFGVIRRNSRRWKVLYAKRWAVERFFKSLKESRRLERHFVRGMRYIRLHALMATLVFQASALVKVAAGELDEMRTMRRKVA